jgi:uncharacterized lipoprotein YddW (UPF0748 family)
MKERVAELFDIYANKLVQFSQQRGRQYWLIFLFILALILVTITPFSGHAQIPSGNLHNAKTIEICPHETNKELRGVWLTNIDSDVLFFPEKTESAIANLARLNFNTVYPTVWNWGYTLYPSSVAEKATGKALDPTEGLQNRDLLQEIIDGAHQQQMAVIPWFEFGFMAPEDSELAKRHPQWLTQRRDGTTIWWEGKVHQRVWLNPLHPEVQQFIRDLLVEIVSNYDIDGIQVDDHFGYPSEFGYDEFTVQLYQAEHSGQLPPENSRDSEWIRWRADKITAYFETLFKEIKQQKPEVIVSVSPNPQEFSLNSFLLDWHQWERKGLIEELIIQVYRNRSDRFIEELNQPELLAAKEHIPVGIGILSGLRGRPILWNQIHQQVQETRDRNFAGVSFFFYESLWNLGAESSERRQNALKSLLNQTAKRPNLSDCQFSQK